MRRLLLALLGAVMLGGCGGSGGANPAAGPNAVPAAQFETVVVRYDRNGDDLPDLLTLDRAGDSFHIVAVLDGTADGGAVDRTDALRGSAIDPAVSAALAAYLNDSFAAGQKTEIDVSDSLGRDLKVTVFE